MFETIKLQLEPYLLTLKIIGLIVIFLAGCYVTHLYYKGELSDAIIAKEKANAALAIKMNEHNTEFIQGTNQIQTEYKYRDRVVDHYIPIDKVSEGFVEWHNAAVEHRELKPMDTEVANKPSDKTLRDLATVLNLNYSSCNKYIIQIEGLQSVLSDIEKANQ